MNRLQLSTGEWLRDHKETILILVEVFTAWSSFLYFHMFSDNLSNKLCGFFVCLIVCFLGEIAFSSGAIPILREKNLTDR